MLRQYGDVVIDTPPSNAPDIVVLRRPTKLSAALTVVAAALLLASLWYWQVARDLSTTRYLGLAMTIVSLAANWRDADELWRKPQDAGGKATYRRLQRVESILTVTVVGGYFAVVFLAPGGKAFWWLAFALTFLCVRVVRFSLRPTYHRLLEPVALPDPALASPPPFRY